jgi:carboxypeptidase Taq
MPTPTTPAYTELCDHLRQAALLDGTVQLLNWDQETYMPERAGAMRADQQAILAGLVHERRTNPRLRDLLEACEGDATLTGDAAVAANLREIRRDYDLATKLPKALVEEIAKTTSRSQEVWKQARAKNDYAMFAPSLEAVLALMRRKAECLGAGPGGELYDALLDLYEPGLTAREVESIFTPLRADLRDLLRAVKESRAKVSTKCLDVEIGKMGFDLKAGRLDTTTHPFCSGFGPGDTRLTTRYRESWFTDALYGTLHEMGHGLYEQGLPKEGAGGKPGLFGQPLADSISLGIHESQSRMWENFVGRSKAFWKWALPKSRKFFGKALAKYGAKDLYAASNTVTPSLIRVEADEGTYNMHVMVRFEIERALLRGEMPVKDIPGEWNRRYKDYLGVKVPDDARGCLQDVHWSFGLVGYFPTYTLGNLYAAQFWEKIHADLPDLSKEMASGEFGDLLAWLRKHIHAHGKRYRAGELCEKVTGKPLSAEPLLRHLRGKAAQVYGV